MPDSSTDISFGWKHAGLLTIIRHDDQLYGWSLHFFVRPKHWTWWSEPDKSYPAVTSIGLGPLFLVSAPTSSRKGVLLSSRVLEKCSKILAATRFWCGRRSGLRSGTRKSAGLSAAQRRMKCRVDCAPRRFDERIATTPEEAHAMHFRLPVNGADHETRGVATKGFVTGLGMGHDWRQDPSARFNSKSRSRKAASALIAKIPGELSAHIARVMKPR